MSTIQGTCMNSSTVVVHTMLVSYYYTTEIDLSTIQPSV